MVYSVLCTYFSCNYDIIMTHKILRKNRENLFKVNSGYLSVDVNYYQKYNKCIMELREKYNILIYEDTSICPNNVDPAKFQVLLNKEISELEGSENGILPSLLKIDNKLLEFGNVKDNEGNILRLGKSDGRIEVAIGSMYEEIMPIGTIFQDKITRKEYVVAKVISDKQKWFNGAIYNDGRAVDLDSYIICGMDLEDYSGVSCMAYYNNVFLYCDKSNAKNVIEDINKIAKQNDIYINVESFSEFEKSYIKEHENLYIFSLVLAILLMLVSMAFIVIVTIVDWMLEKHNIGILYANGFSNKDLFKVIMSENIIRLAIPIMISYNLILFTNLNLGITNIYRDILCGIMYFLFVVSIVIASIVSFCTIVKHVPIDLVYGEK